MNEKVPSNSILRYDDEGQCRSNEKDARVTRDNRIVSHVQRRVLSSSGRSSGGRAAQETRESALHRNRVARTWIRTLPKQPMPNVVPDRHFIIRRTVPSLLHATPAVTGTSSLCKESHIQLESDVCISCWTSDGDLPEQNKIAAIELPTTGRAERM